MNSFKDFDITPSTQGFVGDKIKIDRILNREITVFFYKIGPSNFKGRRLDLQIELNGEKHIVFTSSEVMMDMIERVPKDTGFPFTTTIIKQNERYEFS